MIGFRLLVVALLLSQAVFRGRGDVVEVVVSVRDAGRAAAGLSASDFRVTANGVVQTIEVAENARRPVDVTLAIAVDDNRTYQRADVSPAVGKIVAALRPDDRVRVMVTDADVRDATGWVAGGTPYAFGSFQPGPAGSVGDAVVLAMAHQTAPGRGHLVLGISHWMGAGNIADSMLLFEVARRSTAVMHLLRVDGWRTGCYAGSQMLVRRAIDGGVKCDEMRRNIQMAAEATGGRFSQAGGREPIFNAFKSALEDFRDSYVLYFTPTGVSASGWHTLNVTVPKLPRAEIRARSGY